MMEDEMYKPGDQIMLDHTQADWLNMLAGDSSANAKAMVAFLQRQEANSQARLLRAAPDLLDACRAVTTLPTDRETGSMIMTGPVYRKIVDAIAKAEGRTWYEEETRKLTSDEYKKLHDIDWPAAQEQARHAKEATDA